jgi:hypothetical protein
MGSQSLCNGFDMVWCTPATRADDASPSLVRIYGVICHRCRRGTVDWFSANKLGNTGIGFSYQSQIWVNLVHLLDHLDDLIGTVTTIAA